MKMKYISLAVMAALSTTALTACGGSDSDNDGVSVTPSPTTPVTTPTTGTTTPTAGTTTPTTGTDTAPTVGTTTPTTGTTTGTTTGATTGTTTGTVTAPTAGTATGSTGTGDVAQNPVVNGIDTSKVPSVVGQNYNRRAQANFDYIANNNAANISMPVATGGKTLQDKDMKNIVLGREVFTNVALADGTTAPTLTLNRYAGKISGDDAAADVEYSDVAFTDATRTATAPSTVTVDNSPLQVRNDTVIAAPNTYLAEPADSAGLYYRSSESNVFTQGKTTESAVETANDVTDTRIFGSKAFDADGVYDNNAAVNSYRGISTTTDAATGKFTYTPTSTFQNMKLDNVQYGRVSTNIDALAADKVGKEVVTGQQFVGTEARPFNAADAVNTYFYRGLNETTLAQMAALPQDAVYNYYGHALTYGLNGAAGGSAAANSNSVGDSQTVTTLGDFVAAQYNVANKKVDGNIYNVKFTNNANGVQNPLVTFSGNVIGNTVVGTSSLVDGIAPAQTDRTGSFKGSFYGNAAQELGGAVNSLEGESYGTSTWGGVFGAKRDIAPTPTTGGNISLIEAGNTN